MKINKKYRIGDTNMKINKSLSIKAMHRWALPDPP